jgi:hypothetical protein
VVAQEQTVLHLLLQTLTPGLPAAARSAAVRSCSSRTAAAPTAGQASTSHQACDALLLKTPGQLEPHSTVPAAAAAAAIQMRLHRRWHLLHCTTSTLARISTRMRVIAAAALLQALAGVLLLLLHPGGAPAASCLLSLSRSSASLHSSSCCRRTCALCIAMADQAAAAAGMSIVMHAETHGLHPRHLPHPHSRQRSSSTRAKTPAAVRFGGC